MKRWLLTLNPRRWVTRGGLGYLIMGLIVLCGAAWSFGALVEIGNIATDRAQLTTLPAPYAGLLFAGSVDLFIFYGYLKCYGPAWQIILSVVHILCGLATSVWLQYQHSKGNVDPVLVSVIPPLAVAVSLDTWVVSQLVDWYRRSRARPDWAIPTPLGHPVPEPAQPDPDPEPPPEEPDPVPAIRPRPTQDGGRRPGPVGRGRPSRSTLTPDQQDQVRRWVAEGRTNKSEMARDLDLNNRGRLVLGQLVDQVRDQPVQVSPNGYGGRS